MPAALPTRHRRPSVCPAATVSALLVGSVLLAGCSAASSAGPIGTGTGSRAGEDTGSTQQQGSIASVALALQVAGPVGGTLLSDPTGQGCSTAHAVKCWRVHRSYAQVETEMRVQLRALHVGPVQATDRGLSNDPAGAGNAYLDVSDRARHIRVELASAITGTAEHSGATGEQTVILIADPT